MTYLALRALQQPLGVPFPILRLVAVDVLALKAHDLAIALHHLRRLRARLAVLPSDAADLHRGPRSHVLQDEAHLKDEIHLSLEALGGILKLYTTQSGLLALALAVLKALRLGRGCAVLISGLGPSTKFPALGCAFICFSSIFPLFPHSFR